MSMCRVFSPVVGRGCLLRPVHCLGRTLWAFVLLHSVLQIYSLTSNGDEAKVEWFYDDPLDCLELTHQRDVLFIIGDWNATVGSQEISGVTGKFGLGVQNEAGQRITELCQENTLIIANTLFQQHERRLYTWTSPDGPKWDCLYSLQPKMEKFYTVSKK